jgi:deoxyhypusine synthase
MHTREFFDTYFHHFNALELARAAHALVRHVEMGGGIFFAVAGAMSTARLGIILSRVIRKGYVAGISATAANVEEDVFNMIGRRDYVQVHNWRDLAPADEAILKYRVTDTCLSPAAMEQVTNLFLELVGDADRAGERHYPFEFFRKLLDRMEISEARRRDGHDSWVLAAHELDLPVWTPGWEDSSLSMNLCASQIREGGVKGQSIRSGSEQLLSLAHWYKQQAQLQRALAFVQIGGGISGDFAICVAPTLRWGTGDVSIPHWAYYCQISDSVPSYGSYSGALPREKITWGKIDSRTPAFAINSDAAIVAPLLLSYLLDE